MAFDEAAARVYCRVRADLEQAGMPVGEPDLRIAPIALASGLTLVTGDTGHFQHVTDLVIENWL